MSKSNRHPLSTEDLNPDLVKRRVIRVFAQSHHTSEEHLSLVKRRIGAKYHSYPSRKAIELFSHDERSINRLEEIYQYILELKSNQTK